MKNFFDLVKKVYAYEKDMKIDIRILQIVLYVIGTTLILLDIENFKLGKTGVGILVLISSLIIYFAAFFIRVISKNIMPFIKVVLYILIIFAIPISITGMNDGFAMLWYLLLPIFLLILFGMPFSTPLGIGFGIFCIVIFWSPIRHLLKYSYEDYYLFYYPVYYFEFCLLVFVMNSFYKYYKINQIENEKLLETQINDIVSQQKNLMVTAIATISRMLDEKDEYTQEHSKRVAQYSKLIAENMKSVSFTEEEVSVIYRNALLHDIGKIAVPDEVLNKPARLTDEEYEIMKKHTVWGEKILSNLKFLKNADLGAYYHHERCDGTGYPNGLLKDDIPLVSRIISVADALDAMGSNRCYRRQCDENYIIQEFEKGAGKQFDEELAQIVVKLIKDGKIFGEK